MSVQAEVHDNEIPDVEPRPTVDQLDAIRNRNEIPSLRGDHGDELLSNVLMSHAADDNFFNKTGVLAGGWSLFALSQLLPHSDSSPSLPSSDCRRSHWSDVRRAPHPPPHLSDEEEG